MFLFPLFYVICEFHRFLHRGKAKICRTPNVIDPGKNLTFTRTLTLKACDTINYCKVLRSPSFLNYSENCIFLPFPFPLRDSYHFSVIERFHMTSRRPYWCTKNNETAAILVYQANPVGVEVLSYVNTSFCSNRFT